MLNVDEPREDFYPHPSPALFRRGMLSLQIVLSHCSQLVGYLHLLKTWVLRKKKKLKNKNKGGNKKITKSLLDFPWLVVGPMGPPVLQNTQSLSSSRAGTAGSTASGSRTLAASSG